jgi:hypothetical protein
MTFERRLSEEIIGKLTQEHLYSKYLLPDIEAGNVFPAIRKDKITFYYKGGALFSYDGDGFKTNIKFASVFKIAGARDETYINEQDLREIEKINSFIEGYDRIKENCALYSGIEAIGVSEVCKKYSYFEDNNITVLDVETSFESLTGRNQDRIDLLLLNKTDKTLRFYEAKHYSNSEIWSREGSRPRVVSQIDRYKNQVKERESEIVSVYNGYIKIINTFFKLTLGIIDKIDPNVYLLIFGFDGDQLRGRFDDLIKKDKSLDGIYVYPIGSVSSLKNENLWKCPKKY